MKSKIYGMLMLGLIFVSSAQASSDLYSYSVEYGDGELEVESYTFAVRRDISDFLQGRYKLLEKYDVKNFVEIEVFHWDSPSDGLYGVSSSLVFDKEFYLSSKIKPYIEYSVGAGLISDVNIGGIQMASAFQFKNRIGIGVRYDYLDFFVNVSHLSNAGIVDPNDGIDFVSAGIRFKF